MLLIDMTANSLSWLGFVLMALGLADQAMAVTWRALERAEQLGHAFTLAAMRSRSARLYATRREPETAARLCDAAAAVAEDSGSVRLLVEQRFFTAWAAAADGGDSAAFARLSELMSRISAESYPGKTEHVALFAEVCLGAGRIEEGLAAVAAGLDDAARRGEHFCEAELHRVRGELLLAKAPAQVDDAEACFRRALDCARGQQARWWELRAATSLARLLGESGRAAVGRDLLAEVRRGFDEGADTADVRQAAVLFARLQDA